MSRKLAAGLAAYGLLVAALASVWVGEPGYMDADTYFATARVLHAGGGLQVPFVWNFLAEAFLRLPQPAHLYWMPLTTFVAAASMAVFGDSFNAGRLPFLLLAASLPLLSAWLAGRLGARRQQVLLAGALAGLSGFYLPFLVTTDAFSLFAVVGSLCLFAASAAPSRPAWTWFLAGLLTGLCHLSRADGLLMLVVAIGAWWLNDRRRRTGLGLLLAGYLAVMLPWFVRMWRVTGGPLSPGGLKTAWLTSYNALFTYPASALSLSDWLASGLGAILTARLQAILSNLVSLLVVNGLIYLWPLVFWGAWRLRANRLVRLAAGYLLLLFLAMSLAFPFPGTRGGFFHSASAVMPMVWALAPFGLEAFLEWMSARRGWKVEPALRVLGAGMAVIAAVVTVGLFVSREIGPSLAGRGWGTAERDYPRVAAALPASVDDFAVVAVNNPPGFWLAAHTPAVVIPDGNPARLHEVVRQFKAGWVVLEANHPPGLDALYAAPGSVSWLELQVQVKDSFEQPIYLFKVVEPAGSSS